MVLKNSANMHKQLQLTLCRQLCKHLHISLVSEFSVRAEKSMFPLKLVIFLLVTPCYSRIYV